MQEEGYRVTAQFEESHWWFVSRRDLIRLQLSMAVQDISGEGREVLEILDFGCGTGFNVGLLAEVGNVTAADANIEQVREVFKAPRLTLREVNDQFWKEGWSFDLVTALDVIEHIEDDISTLSNLRSIIRPGGHLILTVPAYQWLWGGEDVISKHKRRYTRKSLRCVAESAGFVETFCSYFNAAILPAAAAVIWWRRLASPGGEPQTNIQHSAGVVNTLLRNITGLENRLIGQQTLSLPFGTSIVYRGTRR